MAKSLRSKWKKKMARAKVEAAKPELLARLSRLKNKLDLVADRKIATVPMQDPCPHFHFHHPETDAHKPLKLSGFSTNVRKGLRGFEGNADGTKGIRSAKALNAQYKQLPGAAAAAAAAAAAQDDSADEAMELRKLQQQIRAGISVIDDEDGGIVGGFDNSDDDEIGGDSDDNDGDDDAAEAAPKKKVTILPKAADKKATGGNSKMKKQAGLKPPTGNADLRRKPKQGYDKKK